ncbi:aldose epimerase family protein [Paenibacillus silvisoli]|uniref:hypothetical protein n=1 Tax=Paenibacillus silvisoli TaxID=3110539 RepID=UPI0028052752|nr:hypothetical protein [Paenibacillus silvisoli]
MRLVVVPELGAKIVSILYKPTGKEWLANSYPRQLQKVEYGSAFDQADLSGWDECFPSILACRYPVSGSFYGNNVPDHGELWSLPWNAHITTNSIDCSVEGRALPYTFSRRMSFLDERTLRFHYSVENTSTEELAVLWCAHPLFQATEHTEMIFPEGVSEVLCVDGGSRLHTGQVYPWPEGDGSLRYPINRIGPASAMDSRKFYVDGNLEHGRAGIMERDTGECLELLWLPEQLPYFGAWINEGAVMEEPVCALEPCNGFFDDLTTAYENNQLLRIGPGRTAEWQLDVRLSRI